MWPGVVLLAIIACPAWVGARGVGARAAPQEPPGKVRPDRDEPEERKGKEMSDEEAPKHTNRLAKEKSPYLLQHAHNPVDWYPWGEEAFRKAKDEDKPIFLSIGYSTCHWCHVMERESFEDEEIAATMNEHFVCIKVDREERPDVDQIYMTAVQALNNGQGGWPLSAFLTPDRKPFVGGTYFPPQHFHRLLEQIANLWKTERGRADEVADHLSSRIREFTEVNAQGEMGPEVLEKAYQDLKGSFDPVYGGFGGGPNKFPRSMDLSFLMRYHRKKGEPAALEMVEKTLERMYRGGMYDHLGGGFHRYSTDPRWLVPHFEKMLYDNALLARTYLEAYQVTGKDLYAEIAGEILDYVLRDMTHPDGGFYSAEDADSEGEEGLFYVWTPKELAGVLGEETGKLLERYFGVTETGNFEGRKSILHLPVHPGEFPKQAGVKPEAWRETLKKAKGDLLELRSNRIRPHRDDKIITSWNGLMISAMAFGYSVLGEERYRDAARRGADFILQNLVKEGRLLRRYREEAGLLGYVDDYAFLGMGLLDLYEATFDVRYFREAVRLTDEMNRLFWDDEGKGYFFVGDDGQELIARTKQLYDGAVPSGNSIAALNLLKLGEWTSDGKWTKRGEETLHAFGNQIAKTPRAYPQTLCAVDFHLDAPKEIVLAGEIGSDDLASLLETIHRRFIPNKVVALVPTGEGAASAKKLMPMLQDRGPLEGKATAYVCENYACKLPTTDPAVLAGQLK